MSSWQGTDYNERVFNSVRNMLVAVQLHGVKGVSPARRGEVHQMVSKEDADRYIDKGRLAYAKLAGQKAPRAVKARYERQVKELDNLITKAVAIREGKSEQKMTEADYEAYRKSLGLR